MRFANDFHSWLRHSWKSLANRLTRDPKIVIHGNSCIILYIILYMVIDMSSSRYNDILLWLYYIWLLIPWVHHGTIISYHHFIYGNCYELIMVQLYHIIRLYMVIDMSPSWYSYIILLSSYYMGIDMSSSWYNYRDCKSGRHILWHCTNSI